MLQWCPLIFSQCDEGTYIKKGKSGSDGCPNWRSHGEPAVFIRGVVVWIARGSNEGTRFVNVDIIAVTPGNQV